MGFWSGKNLDNCLWIFKCLIFLKLNKTFFHWTSLGVVFFSESNDFMVVNKLLIMQYCPIPPAGFFKYIYYICLSTIVELFCSGVGQYNVIPVLISVPDRVTVRISFSEIPPPQNVLLKSSNETLLVNNLAIHTRNVWIETSVSNHPPCNDVYF